MSAILRPGDIRFRPMLEEDVAQIMKIENIAYPYPWTYGIFRDCLRVGYYCQVLEQDGDILGYGVMSIAVGEAHILNLCVHPDFQGQGLGKLLMQHLLDAARRMHAELALLEVRPSNRSAIRLYRSFGFNEVGTRKAYYPDSNGREDAIIFALTL